MVFAMLILVLPAYFSVVFIPFLLMSLLHTAQDWLKVYATPRLGIHPVYTYTADQASHYVVIVIMQVLIAALLIPSPSLIEDWVMGMGACIIIMTRFYEVSWWANWFDMMPYMNRWRVLSYAERLAAFGLSVTGLFFLAPLCVLPRLYLMRRAGQPIWKQPNGTLEMGLGIVTAIVLGVLMMSLNPMILR
jgi:hypothetical protein